MHNATVLSYCKIYAGACNPGDIYSLSSSCRLNEIGRCRNVGDSIESFPAFLGFDPSFSVHQPDMAELTGKPTAEKRLDRSVLWVNIGRSVA